MIKFEGKLSRKCKKIIIKLMLKRYYAAAIIAFLFITATHVFGILITGSLIWLAVILVNVFVFGIGPYFYAQSRDIRKYVPEAIIINTESQKIEVDCKMKKTVRDFKTIKKITDCGEYYVVYHSLKELCDSCVLQKSLIKQGTIEDFESLFVTKIAKR